MEFKLSSVLEISNENLVDDVVRVTLINVKDTPDTKSTLQLNLCRGNERGFIRSVPQNGGHVRWTAVTDDNGGFFIINNAYKVALLEKAYVELVGEKINS